MIKRTVFGKEYSEPKKNSIRSDQFEHVAEVQINETWTIVWQ